MIHVCIQVCVCTLSYHAQTIWLYVCMYASIYVCIHLCGINGCIHTYHITHKQSGYDSDEWARGLYIHDNMSICTHTHAHMHTYTCTHTHTRQRPVHTWYINTYMIHTYIHKYIHNTYIHKYIHNTYMIHKYIHDT